MSLLSPREELLKLHRQLFRKNKLLIRDSVIHEDPDFISYEKRYLDAVRDYQSTSSLDEMMEAVLHADIVYIGDYHTLKQSQRSLLRIIRLLVEQTKKFCIAMEIIQARYQQDLERYMAGKLSDKTFLKRIGFKEHWFFDLWENFKPVFDFVKYHHIPVFGLEANPDEALSLRCRDQQAAKIIFDLFQKTSHKPIMVFIGDLHLAPQNLPREVKKIFQHEKIPVKTVTLYQNSESIYWKLAEREEEDRVGVVKISDQEFCRMHTPPIIAQQSYLNWLEHEEGELDFADAKQTFVSYMDQIAQFLGIELGAEKEDVEVFTCGDLSFLRRLREAKIFSPKELREIKRQILRSESYYIPKIKLAYLANVSVNHAAEEASHTIRHLCAGEEFPRPMQDAFYANVLHEALGFFGSKIINPRRKCMRVSDARGLINYLSVSKRVQDRNLEYQTAKLFLEHEDKIRKNNGFHANKISALSIDLFFGLTHAIGYFLGEKMFYGLLHGKLDKATVKDLFFDPMDEDGETLRQYFLFEEKLKGVLLPKRM